jgi:hypothetical protein
VSIHLDEGKASIGLESGLDDVAKVLEEWDEVILSGVGSEISDIDCGLPLRSLVVDHIIALNSMSREMMMAIGSGRCHTHGCHLYLLIHGWLTFLIGPIAANCSRSKPLSVHGGKSLFGISTLTESYKSIASRATSLHVPHDTGFGHGTKGRESL